MSPRDPLTFVVLPLLLAAVSRSGVLPAGAPGGRVDPVVAIRSDAS